MAKPKTEEKVQDVIVPDEPPKTEKKSPVMTCGQYCSAHQDKSAVIIMGEISGEKTLEQWERIYLDKMRKEA